jgi:hypothetical protein
MLLMGKRKKLSVYIAGPMTGYDDWNFSAFFEAEKQLKELGYWVLNPAHNDGTTVKAALLSAGSPDRPNHSWAYYMKRDLPHVMEADMLCVLPGWKESKGASLEVHVAKALGLPIMVLKDGKLIPRVTAIGLSGWARAGKDTAADHLVADYGYTKMSFADPMREALIRLNPLIHIGGHVAHLAPIVEKTGWEDLKTISSDIRPLLQRFGTEVGREMFGENFWVDAAIDRIPDGGKVVFADVRFPNEADAIRELGGFVIRVERDGFGPANDHISEHALDNYDFDGRLFNNGTIEDLNKLVDVIFSKE